MKSTTMLQLEPTATVSVRHVLDGSMEKGDPAVTEIKRKSGKEPVLVRMALSWLWSPMPVAGNDIGEGVSVAVVGGGPIPVPLNCATSGELGSLLAKLTVPVSGPGPCGLNVTATVQDAPTARGEVKEQVPVSPTPKLPATM
jgi:hypothetical protein